MLGVRAEFSGVLFFMFLVVVPRRGAACIHAGHKRGYAVSKVMYNIAYLMLDILL